MHARVMVGVAQLVRASGCGPEGRGFESHRSPHYLIRRGPLAQLVEQLTLNQRVAGSSPARPTSNEGLCRWRQPSFFAPLAEFDLVVGVCRFGGRCAEASLTTLFANVAELVDALDLGSSGATRGSSSLPIRTIPSAARLAPFIGARVYRRYHPLADAGARTTRRIAR
jgi:hypothetical protein